MNRPIIVGAGLAGLITACKIKNAEIWEAAEGPNENHKALLRFRDDSVSYATGVAFRKVTVHKSIYWEEKHHDACNPMFANSYARKVTGSFAGDRSIWNLETVQRHIAPEDFYERLVQKHHGRIEWSRAMDHITRSNQVQVVNTAPLPVMIAACGLERVEAAFTRSDIEVLRFRLPRGTDLYQTVYFPEPDLRTYRASITGDLLIIERVKTCSWSFGWKLPESVELECVCGAFGLSAWDDIVEIERVDQKYGKIVDIPRAQREAILYELTRDFNVFSVGRFATWRNILLDDVVKDIDIVIKLMAASTYGRELVLAGR
jgi:hypothetical protein